MLESNDLPKKQHNGRDSLPRSRKAPAGNGLFLFGFSLDGSAGGLALRTYTREFFIRVNIFPCGRIYLPPVLPLL